VIRRSPRVTWRLGAMFPICRATYFRTVRTADGQNARIIATDEHRWTQIRRRDAQRQEIHMDEQDIQDKTTIVDRCVFILSILSIHV